MIELHLHLRFSSGWISVGSVPSPLDDPRSEATQPRGDPDLHLLNSGVPSITLGRCCSAVFFVVTRQGEDFTPGR